MKKVNRSEYVKEYRSMADDLIYKENLPLINDILEFAVNDKANDKLQKVFDFFGDEDELRNLVTRDSVKFTEDESKEFVDSVIAANVTDISESGSIYKKLMATGDNYRIRGKDCHSNGRKIELPITEEEFKYNIRNSYFTLEKGSQDYQLVDTYEEFSKLTDDMKEVWVRSPITCKNHTNRGCCPICAGELPDGVQNIGAFSTLMITEVATQAALSSMNKGRKINVNFLLTKNGSHIKTKKEFFEWCEEILNDLQGDSVERRYYEIALLGRLHIDKENKTVKVVSLANPSTDNYFGEFIYKPNETSFKRMISHGVFHDDSLKAQIALNTYKKGIF